VNRSSSPCPQQCDLLRSDWSQPRWTRSLRSVLTAPQFRWYEVSWDEIRWDEMSDMNVTGQTAWWFQLLQCNALNQRRQFPHGHTTPVTFRYVWSLHRLEYKGQRGVGRRSRIWFMTLSASPRQLGDCSISSQARSKAVPSVFNVFDDSRWPLLTLWHCSSFLTLMA